MTEQQSLLAAIIADPADDLPRLVYADWLDENGEGERAEFIRVQLQLARPKMDCHHHDWAPAGPPWCNVCQLREREYELASAYSGWPPGWFMKFDRDTFRYDRQTAYVGRDRDTFRYDRQTAYVGRGFIRRLRCSWDNWLKADESIYWHPSQTVECPACGGDGYQDDGMNGRPCRKCRVDGRSTGRIARPCPLTAQPLEMVEATSLPPLIAQALEIVGCGDYLAGGVRFDRLKCETCDGIGPCPDCHGEPLNRWTCPLWPSVVFVMPENSR